MQVATETANFLDVLQIVRIINKGAEIYLVRFGKVFQQVVRTHFVALVGRIGETMDKIKNIRHD